MKYEEAKAHVAKMLESRVWEAADLEFLEWVQAMLERQKKVIQKEMGGNE